MAKIHISELGNSVNKKNDASGIAFVRYLPILQSESNSQDYTNVDHSIVT